MWITNIGLIVIATLSLLIMVLLMIMFYICGFCDMMRIMNGQNDDLNYQNDIDLETVVKLVNKNHSQI